MAAAVAGAQRVGVQLDMQNAGLEFRVLGTKPDEPKGFIHLGRSGNLEHYLIGMVVNPRPGGQADRPKIAWVGVEAQNEELALEMVQAVCLRLRLSQMSDAEFEQTIDKLADDGVELDGYMDNDHNNGKGHIYVINKIRADGTYEPFVEPDISIGKGALQPFTDEARTTIQKLRRAAEAAFAQMAQQAQKNGQKQINTVQSTTGLGPAGPVGGAAQQAGGPFGPAGGAAQQAGGPAGPAGGVAQPPGANPPPGQFWNRAAGMYQPTPSAPPAHIVPGAGGGVPHVPN